MWGVRACVRMSVIRAGCVRARVVFAGMTEGSKGSAISILPFDCVERGEVQQPVCFRRGERVDAAAR